MSKSNWQQLSQERKGCSLLSQKQSERLLAVNHQQGLAILAVFLYTDEKKTYSCEIIRQVSKHALLTICPLHDK